jgi:hypothetical protein
MMSNDKLVRRQFLDVSSIAVTYYSPRPESGVSDEVLVVVFEGTYRRGSLGNLDAGYACGQILAGIYTWNPKALVLDLRGLSYEWGDQMSLVLLSGRQSRRLNLDHVFQAGGPVEFEELPTTVVISELNGDGLTSLLSSVMKEPSERWLYDTLEQAVSAVCERIGMPL